MVDPDTRYPTSGGPELNLLLTPDASNPSKWTTGQGRAWRHWADRSLFWEEVVMREEVVREMVIEED